MPEQRVNETEGESKEITRSEEWRKKLIEIKLNMISMTYETVSNGLLYV